jgi:hypothetical protein
MLQAIQKASMILILAAGVLACQNNKDNSVREQAQSELASSVQPIEATPEAAQNPQVPSGPTTSLQFIGSDRYNFGKIKAGAKARHVFKFKNTGKEPLIIADAKASCGCTTPSWPKQPIAPGKTGEIVVEFDSAGKFGGQSKKVTIVANTDPPETYCYMEGEVEEDAAAAAKQE